MNHPIKSICGLVLALFCAATPALAEVPTQMSIQGRLTSAGGGPVPEGPRNFTFRIYDQPSFGVLIWPAGFGETQVLTTDANGLWSTSLGKVTPLTELVFQSPDRWLEISVQDSVGPLETLPRVKLNTNAYAFHAASSQRADTLGGMTVSDFEDTFVNEAADTMSGPLLVVRANANLGPLLEIANFNNSMASVFDPVTAMGAVMHATSDNDFMNIGTVGLGMGLNTYNLGVYGIGWGDSSYNFGLVGEAQGGIKNLGGMFLGDVTIESTSGGDTAVILPADAVSAYETLDEPGIAQGRNSGEVLLGDNTNALTTIASVTLTTPGDGYIQLHGRCNAKFLGGTDGHAFLQISSDSGGALVGGLYSLVTGLAAAEHYQNLCTQRTFFKPAGTHTFYLEGVENYAGTVQAVYGTLTATFFPTAYGSVSTLVHAQEAGQFEHAAPAESRARGVQEAGSAIVYDVDLRELELEVARRQAEANRARRELLLARLASVRRPTQSPFGTTKESGQ